jgi:glycerophosphoryl diester phosphodiesterase
MLNELHKMGIKIALWTVDSKSDVEDIKEFVDYVITNDVRLFVE